MKNLFFLFILFFFQHCVLAQSGGVSSFVISIEIKNPSPPVINYATPQVYTVNTDIIALSPNNTGGTIVSYAISPALPLGLTFNTTTGVISGTATAVTPALNYTVTASNAGGSSSFVLSIQTRHPNSPVISYETPQVYTEKSGILPLSPTSTGGVVVSYAISPDLPAGLSLNTSTGVISGTPTAVTTATSYTITATNVDGSGTFVISIQTKVAMPMISYSSPQVFELSSAVSPLAPNNTGGAVDSFEITPALPTGLSFNTFSGVISGTPTAVTPATNYFIKATNTSGSGSCVVSIQTRNPIDKPIISYPTPQIFTLNSAITPLSPTSNGGVVDSYSISPYLPFGLSLDTSTGVISGTPDEITAATNYTITATNAGGSVSTTINITVNAFTIDKNNFTVDSKGESCTNANNGSITITAKATNTYIASVNGTSHNFAGNVLSLENLPPNTYNIVVSISGQSYSQEFKVVIPKAATISARSSLLSGSLAVDVEKGTAPYTVSINGQEQFDTSAASFSLAVKPGDVLEVKTAKTCEGVYSQSIDKALGNLLACFPNPTYGSFEIAIPDATQATANIEMFTMGGQLLAKGTYPIKDKKVQLSLDGKPKGMYIVKVYVDNMEYGLKIIKK